MILTKVVVWFIMFMSLITLSFNMMSAANTVENILGVIILIYTVAISIKTKCTWQSKSRLCQRICLQRGNCHPNNRKQGDETYQNHHNIRNDLSKSPHSMDRFIFFAFSLSAHHLLPPFCFLSRNSMLMIRINTRPPRI